MSASKRVRGRTLGLKTALCIGVVGVIAISFDLRSAVPGEDDPLYKYLQLYTKVLTLTMTRYVDPVEGRKLVYGSLQGMLSKLDPYSMFLTPEDLEEMKRDTTGQFGGIGIEVVMQDGKIHVITPIRGGPAEKAGMLPGDKIIKIDDALTKDMTFLEAVKNLRGARGSQVTLFVERGSQIIKFSLKRDRISQESVETSVLDKDILLLRVSQFQQGTTQRARKEIENFLSTTEKPKGVIIDFRNNPGGLLNEAISFSELFIKEGNIVYTIDREGNKKVEKAHSLNTFEAMPMVILTNRGTASASEIVSGAFKDYNLAILAGQNTFGKASVQSVIEMPDGSGVKLTVAKYYTPEGMSIHEKGIAPDVEVAEPESSHLGEVINGKPDTKPAKDETDKAAKGITPEPADPLVETGKRLVTKLWQKMEASTGRRLPDVVKTMIRRKDL